MEKARLIDYFDVWGNEYDGFDVNDQSDEGIIELESLDKTDIVDALVDIGFLKRTVKPDMLEFYESDSMIELMEKNGRPLCAIDFFHVDD